MEQFIEQASYEELMQTYRMLVITADSPEAHTSQDMGAVLNGAIDKLIPQLETEYAANGIAFNADNFRQAVLSEHVNVNGSGMMSGPDPLDRLTQSAYAMAPDIDVSAITDLKATIETSNESWRAIEGTMEGNPSAFIGAYVDARMQISGAESALAAATASGDADAVRAAKMDMALGQAMFTRIDAVLPEDMRDSAETAYAAALEHEARRLDGDLPYQRIGAAVAYTATHPVEAAPFVWQGVETFGSNIIATPGYLLDLGNMGTGWAFDVSYEGSAGSFIQENALAGIDFMTGTPVAETREQSDIVTGTAVIGEAALIVATLGTTAAPRAGAMAGRLTANGARLAEDGAAILTHGPTRAAAAALDEVPTAAFRPGATMSDDLIIAGLDDAATAAPRVVEVPTSIPRVPRTAEGPWGPAPRTAATPAADAAETGARTAAEGAEVAARPGNMATRGFAAVASKNSPRGIYRSTDSAADRLMRLSRAEDTVAAERYTTRIINDIGAGRPNAAISETELSALRTSGRFGDETLDALTAAKDASRSAWGRTGHRLSHLGDTFRANASVGGALSMAGDVALAPVTGMRWALSWPLSTKITHGFVNWTNAAKLTTVWGGVAADGYLFDGKIQDTLGDAFGATYRGVGDALDAVGVPFIGDASHVAAAAVDPDQTVAGTLRDAGYTTPAWAAGLAAPFVSTVVPGEQTGRHTAIETTPDPVVTTTPDPAAAGNGTGPAAAAPAAAAAAGIDPDDAEGFMRSLIEQVADSPVGNFLDQIGPWGQMFAAAIGLMFAGKAGLWFMSKASGMDFLNGQLTATAAIAGAIYAAPKLADMFHEARDNTGPKPSEVAANAIGGFDVDKIMHDGKEFIGMAAGPSPA